MIEIVKGTLEERIIKILQKKYPITISDLEEDLRVPKKAIERMLHKFWVKGIVQLEILPDKTFIRLVRNDFSFIGKKRQKKFIKRSYKKEKRKPEYEGIMYS